MDSFPLFHIVLTSGEQLDPSNVELATKLVDARRQAEQEAAARAAQVAAERRDVAHRLRKARRGGIHCMIAVVHATASAELRACHLSPILSRRVVRTRSWPCSTSSSRAWSDQTGSWKTLSGEGMVARGAGLARHQHKISTLYCQANFSLLSLFVRCLDGCCPHAGAPLSCRP